MAAYDAKDRDRVKSVDPPIRPDAIGNGIVGGVVGGLIKGGGAAVAGALGAARGAGKGAAIEAGKGLINSGKDK